MPRVANCAAKNYVDGREPFRGNNTYGETLADGSYVVYSYGPHWPLYLWFAPTASWYGNPAKYSRTTSRHANQLRPRAVTIRHLDKLHMQTLVRLCNDTCVHAALHAVGATTTTLEAVSRAFEVQSWHRLRRANLSALSEDAAPQPTILTPPGPRRLLPLQR